MNFSVTDKCVCCGLCAEVSPAGNIATDEESAPQFPHRCDHCLACVNWCPQNAIEWKDKTCGKERYKSKHASSREMADFWHSGG